MIPGATLSLSKQPSLGIADLLVRPSVPLNAGSLEGSSTTALTMREAG